MPGRTGLTVEEGVKTANSWLKSERFMLRVGAPMAVCESEPNCVIKGILAAGIGSLV
jgi:hypothetical protein